MTIAQVGARRAVDVRRLRDTREVVVQRSGGLFPVLALTREGHVVAALRGGAGHHGLTGRIDLVRSRDAGRTWSAPMVVVDSDWDDSNKAFGRTPSGRLVLAYLSNGRYAANGDYEGFAPEHDPGWRTRLSITTSDDDGFTWAPPRPLDIPELRGGSPFGRVATLDDRLTLMAIYASVSTARHTIRSRSWLVESTDDGRTWDACRPIADGMNETGLVGLQDGTLVAVMRSETDASLNVARSVDVGRTWSAPVPVTASNQHPADLHVLHDGSVLLAYGNRNPPYRIEGLVSRDGGRTWLDVLLLLSGPLYGVEAGRRRVDLGYPSTAVVRDGSGPGRGVTVYYYNPTLTEVDDVWRSDANPLFSTGEYTAVGVSWSEAELLDLLG